MKTKFFHLLALLNWMVFVFISQSAWAAIFFVTNTNDSGAGSLRQAIIGANDNPGSDRIEFNIPKNDPGFHGSTRWRIIVKSLLPSLTDHGTEILGETQTTNQGDTNKTGPEVEINGSYLSSTSWLLSVESNNNTVSGCAVTFSPGAGIRLIANASGNKIIGNSIGYGSYLGGIAPNSTGVELFGGANSNVIRENLISNNKRHGIMIGGNGTDNNSIKYNLIGLNPIALEAPNGMHGILIMNGASGNTVDGNNISRNNNNGIYISDSDTNNIISNVIGIGGHKKTVGMGNKKSGIVIDNSSKSNWVFGNLIMDNHDHGILIQGIDTGYNYVHNNLIGTLPDNTILPNYKHGIGIYDGAHHNEIGNLLDSNKGNIIAGSGWSGVVVVSVGSDHNTICRNFIGIDKKGNATNLGNNYYGIHIVEGADNHIFYNHIAFNGLNKTKDGIRIEGSNAVRNTISQNSIHDNGWKGIHLIQSGNAGIAIPKINNADYTSAVGTACPNCTVEIFSDKGDQGRIFEGSIVAESDSSFWLNGNFNGTNLTATATDNNGNTSEFSMPFYIGHKQ